MIASEVFLGVKPSSEYLYMVYEYFLPQILDYTENIDAIKIYSNNNSTIRPYKFLFLIFIVIGAAASMKSIWDFSGAMIFAMVFPNMVGLYFLFPVVKKQMNRYLDAIKFKKAA